MKDLRMVLWLELLLVTPVFVPWEEDRERFRPSILLALERAFFVPLQAQSEKLLVCDEGLDVVHTNTLVLV